MKASAHEALLVILLLTGFCVPCSPSTFSDYFVKEAKTFDGALEYCRLEHIDMAQIFSEEDHNALMKTPIGSYTGNAWIGLFENSSDWIWLNGEMATYVNWIPDEPIEIFGPERCVIMDDQGKWLNITCSTLHTSVCFNGSHYETIGVKMTWEDAVANCDRKGSVLPNIFKEYQNDAVRQYVNTSSFLWIGLSRPKRWFWSDTGEEISNFFNWQPGKPVVLNKDSCAAISLNDGTWTNEPCDIEKPFFCYGVSRSRQTVVKMVMESRTDLGNEVISDKLQQKIVAALTRKGITDFELTWNKLPVKVKEMQQRTEDYC